MQPKVYAAFDRLETAEQAVASLIASGVQPGDVSLVAGGRFIEMKGDEVIPLSMADAGFLDPAGEMEYVGSGLSREASRYASESSAGAGIATVTADDDITDLQESDDPVMLEDELFEADQLNLEELEAQEAAAAADHGFSISSEPQGGLYKDGLIGAQSVALLQDMTSFAVQGYGLLVGDGPMSTAITAAAFSQTQTSRPTLHDAMRSYLAQAELSPQEVSAHMGRLQHGAVIEVVAPAGRVPIETVESIIRRHSGRYIAVKAF